MWNIQSPAGPWPGTPSWKLTFDGSRPLMNTTAQLEKYFKQDLKIDSPINIQQRRKNFWRPKVLKRSRAERLHSSDASELNEEKQKQSTSHNRRPKSSQRPCSRRKFSEVSKCNNSGQEGHSSKPSEARDSVFMRLSKRKATERVELDSAARDVAAYFFMETCNNEEPESSEHPMVIQSLLQEALGASQEEAALELPNRPLKRQKSPENTTVIEHRQTTPASLKLASRPSSKVQLRDLPQPATRLRAIGPKHQGGRRQSQSPYPLRQPCTNYRKKLTTMKKAMATKRFRGIDYSTGFKLNKNNPKNLQGLSVVGNSMLS